MRKTYVMYAPTCRQSHNQQASSPQTVHKIRTVVYNERYLGPSDEDVVYGYVNELDEVANEAHNSESDSDCPADLSVLLVGRF